jgi:hypothetical protein
MKACHFTFDMFSFVPYIAEPLLLTRVRVTAMEGSFGTHKKRYSLCKVQAMTRKTEFLYIFFGIHAANLVTLAGRPLKKQLGEAA